MVDVLKRLAFRNLVLLQKYQPGKLGFWVFSQYQTRSHKLFRVNTSLRFTNMKHALGWKRKIGCFKHFR